MKAALQNPRPSLQRGTSQAGTLLQRQTSNLCEGFGQPTEGGMGIQVQALKRKGMTKLLVSHLKPRSLLYWGKAAVLVGKSSADRTLMKDSAIPGNGAKGRSLPGQ